MVSVLYVDDDPDLLEISKIYLERTDAITVDTALSAREALDVLAERPYDAIVSDFQMPGMDGIEFLKEVRARYGDLPFILFTGKGREEVVIAAINNGADFYLQKGGDPKSQFAELLHKVRKAVERRQAIDAVKNSEQRFAGIINFLPDATFAIDRSGYVIAWNRAIEEMTGVPAAAMMGKGNYEYAIPFYSERHPILIDLILASDTEIARRLYSILKKEGDAITAETSAAEPLGSPKTLFLKASLLYDKGGHVVGAIESIRDITDRKKIEDALRQSEEQCSSAIEGSGVGLWDWRVNTGELVVNERWAEIVGLTLAELGPGSIEKWTKLCHPDDLVRSNDLLEVHFAKKTPIYECEVRMLHADGHWVWVLDRGRVAEWDARGRPVRMTGTHLDISERKRTERSLQIQHDLVVALAAKHSVDAALDEILSAMTEIEPFDSGGIYLADPITGSLDLALHRGLSPEFVGQVSHSDPASPYFADALKGTAKYGYFPDFPLVAAKPVLRNEGIRAFASIPLLNQGHLLAVINVASHHQDRIPEKSRDLLEILATQIGGTVARIRSQDALRASEERFREIFNNTNDAIYLIEVDADRQPGRFIDLNATACGMLGYSRDELLAANAGAVTTGYYHPPLESVIEEMTTARHAIFESEHIGKDGTIIPVEINAHVITLQGKPAVLAAVRDITGRKQDEQILRRRLDLITSLQRCDTFGEILGACLSAAIEISGTDAGGVYLVDPATGCMDLAISRNLSDRFIARISHYAADSPNAKMVMAGHTAYLNNDQLDLVQAEEIEQEGLRAIAFVPIISEGRVLACLNIASRRFDAIPARSRIALETISTYIGNALARKIAEEALYASEERYKSLIAHMTEGVALHEVVYDNGVPVEYRIIDANPGFESILGSAKEKILGKLSRDAYSVADPPYLELYSRVAGTGTPTTFETYFPPIDRHFSISAYSPKKGQFATVFTDITQRKKAEESLRRSEERYRLLADNVEDVIWIFDPAPGQLSYVSPSVGKLLGFTPQEIVGRSIEVLLPEEAQPMLRIDLPRRLATFEAGDDTVRVQTYPMDLIRKDGSIVSTEMVTTLLAGPDRRVTAILGVSRDCTDRKRAEDALLHANRQLQLLSSITRHDILNKISVLRGYLDLAGETATNPAMVEMIGKISSIAATINNQIEFTRVYENLGSQKPQWQPLAAVLPYGQAPREIAFEVSLDGIEVFADPMLPKVFSNLLDNAIRHGGRVTRIRVRAERTGNGLTIVWEDDGVGIPSAEKTLIFERGYGKNTGLGLFLVREILTVTGISIREAGTPGEGARFEILVPTAMHRTGTGS